MKILQVKRGGESGDDFFSPKKGYCLLYQCTELPGLVACTCTCTCAYIKTTILFGNSVEVSTLHLDLWSRGQSAAKHGQEADHPGGHWEPQQGGWSLGRGSGEGVRLAGAGQQGSLWEGGTTGLHWTGCHQGLWSGQTLRFCPRDGTTVPQGDIQWGKEKKQSRCLTDIDKAVDFCMNFTINCIPLSLSKFLLGC